MSPLTTRTRRLATSAVFLGALAALAPTTADFGLTWDEPAYRYSQELSVEWWERLAAARSTADVAPLLDPDALLYYWPYGRFGINFHPPLAGQLNLLSWAVLGRFIAEIPARRMATVVEFAATIALLFGFLARRSGPWAGAVAAASLLLMPRLYGQAHLVDTDVPGLLIWAATAFAAWRGLAEPGGRRWRAAVGVLVGLGFVEKMGAVLVVLPILGWLVATRLPRADRRAWVDGLATSAALLAPLIVAFVEIRRLEAGLPPPRFVNLHLHRPYSPIPGAILLAPAIVWLARRWIGRRRPDDPTWGATRPGLELWSALLAFAPPVVWLGNPAWWRETLPRLAHYAMLNTDRRGALPDIQILYLGQIYEYSLPWHNGFVLAALTVPASILAAAVVGLVVAARHPRRDPLPAYFLIHMLTLPVLRMLPTPAHDGVRLFLPTFLFLAAFAGWGVAGLGSILGRRLGGRPHLATLALAAATLGPAATQLVGVHPYELSYYGELIGGPRGAWRRGFELTYWYDSLDPGVVADLNEILPPGASIQFANEMSNPQMVPQDLQAMGLLRGDLDLGGWPVRAFPYKWLATQDSKADGFSRLLFAMGPRYAREPRQLAGARVFTVADPRAVSRAWALQAMVDAPDLAPPDGPAAPVVVRRWLPPLARFWGDGLAKIHRLTVNEPILDWARRDPDGLRRAAAMLATLGPDRPPGDAVEGLGPGGRRLLALIASKGATEAPPGTIPEGLRVVLSRRPRAIVEAAEILARRPEDVRRVMTRSGYTEVASIGGSLDREVDAPAPRPGP